MKSHNEEKEYITIGSKEFEVSNIPYNRIVKASEIWEQERLQEYKTQDKKIKQFHKMIMSSLIYLVRQPLKILLRRYTLKTAIKEYFKRLILTHKYIKSSTKEDYENLEDWIYYKITGKKKASLVRQKGLLDLMEETLVEMEKATSLNTEACLKLLQTFVQDQTKTLIQSTTTQKVS